MLHLNRYIFYSVCDKDIDKYNDIVDTIRSEYISLVNQLNYVTKCCEVRKIIHELIGVVAIFDGSNSEVMYILKSILHIDKKRDDFSMYKYYIDILLQIDYTKMF